MSLQDEMLGCAREAGGALRTREHRERICREFCGFLRERNIQTRHIQHVKARQIQDYIQYQQSRGLGKRTLQNTLAALRTTLTTAGREKFAGHRDLSNASLGLSGASRDGTHEAVPDDLYAQAYEKVRQEDPGAAVVMALQRALGLRALEALRPQADTLKRWEREALIKGAIHVIEGTKGGRPRAQTVIDADRALAAIREARQVLRQTGRQYLVEGESKTLKSAYHRYQNVTRTAGLKGKYASHGLRYAWARDAMQYYPAQGYSVREARAKVAQDLGHGDGRGRYVTQVYYGKT
ncbi:integrase domain-containing protein [Acidithiobacillus sulfuriphilus]|uniref:DNA-binding protein n=2 Tax=Acidithiobacillus sulfuriphilus TaxID=1867749 RepID=A0A3M8RKU6_9PROT|nr:integrase domain-containing protein [Acidithiobacillus sulfuriphilus]RNF67140.1 DNA-binding protein [Acidithiobacillus sulfuriphilus]